MYRRHVRARVRLYYQRARRFILHRVLHADDPPHQLALGVAIGVFVMITPTIGIQSGLTILLAWLLGANKLIGLPVLWASNPLLYYGCYKVGVLLTGAEGVDPEWWDQVMNPPAGHSFMFYWSRFTEVAMPIWVGCLLVAAVAAPVCYVVTYRLIRVYRLRRWGQLVPPVPEAPAKPEAERPTRRHEGKHEGKGDARPRLSDKRQRRTHTSSAT